MKITTIKETLANGAHVHGVSLGKDGFRTALITQDELGRHPRLVFWLCFAAHVVLLFARSRGGSQ